MNDPPPPELLLRLRPIPTYRDHPATSPHDIEGVTPAGSPVRIALVGSTGPSLLLFLASDRLGCRDLWEGTAELRRSLPDGLRLILVTRGPEQEDVSAVAALAPSAELTVMSTGAYVDYRVGGAPFLVVVDGPEVRTEGVAWGIAETVRATRSALDGAAGDGTP